MIEVITMAAIPAVLDYIMVRDSSEKVRQAKLREFYRSINE